MRKARERRPAQRGSAGGRVQRGEDRQKDGGIDQVIDVHERQTFPQASEVLFGTEKKEGRDEQIPQADAEKRTTVKGKKGRGVKKDEAPFDQRIAERDPGFAAAASSAQKEPADHGDLIRYGDPAAAERTEAVLCDQRKILTDPVVDRGAVRADDGGKQDDGKKEHAGIRSKRGHGQRLRQC